MTFSEAAMIMMSGGNSNIQPLSITANGSYEASKDVAGYNPVIVNVPTDAVTEGISITTNGTYTPSKGVDGYNPVIVNVDDKYDEGYADGEAAVKAKIQSKIITVNGVYYASKDDLDGFDPINVQVPDKYQDGYDKGYSDGFEFASNAFSGVVDETKLYTAVMDLSEPVYDGQYPGLNWIYVRLYKTSDLNTELSHNNIWPTNMHNCYYAKIIKLWWGSSNTLHYQLRSYNSDKTVEFRPEGNTSGTPIAWYGCNNTNTNVIVKY